MIPADVLKCKSLFSLLYEIDLDLTERTRAKGCPFAGVGCIVPIMRESLGADLLILMGLLMCVSVCVAVVPAADAGYCRRRYVFGDGGFIGHRFFCWSAPFARDKNPQLPWSGSRGCAVYGDPRSSAGSAISRSFSKKAGALCVYPVT